MSTLSLSNWKNENYYGEEIEKMIDSYDAEETTKLSEISENIQEPVKQKNQTTKEKIILNLESLENLKEIKKIVEANLIKIELEESSNYNLLKTFSDITEQSNSLLKERNNVETLTIEIDSILKFSINEAEYNIKTTFLDQFNGLNDFYKYSDKLILTLDKTIKGLIFFNARINYKDSNIQIFRYSRILERLKIIFKNLFRLYYSEYFEILNKLFANKNIKNILSKENNYFLLIKLENFDVQNLFVILLLFKFPLFFRDYLKKGFLTQFFEGENSEIVNMFKKVAMNMTLNLDYHSGFATKFETILKKSLPISYFSETKNEIYNFYFLNYFQLQIVIFEKVFADIDDFTILVEIVLLSIIEIVCNSIKTFDESITIENIFNKNINIFFEKINQSIFNKLKKINDFNLFCEKQNIIMDIFNNSKDFESLLPFIKTEEIINLKKYCIYISKFFESFLDKNSKNFIYILQMYFLNSLIDKNLNYAEYLLNRIIQQEFEKPEILKEFRKNSFDKFFEVKNNIAFSSELILYLFPKVLNYSSTNPNLKNFAKIILRKGFSRIYAASELFKNDFDIFLFKIKNFYFLFQNLKDEKYEFNNLFEFDQNPQLFLDQDFFFNKIVGKFDTYQLDKIYFVFSDAMSFIFNKEIFRLTQMYKKIFELEKDIKFVEVEIKLNFQEFRNLCFNSLESDCMDIIKNLFVPFLLSNIQKNFLSLVDNPQDILFLADEEFLNAFA